jgi:5-methylcytosine-specific restriction endonuclease McrA
MNQARRVPGAKWRDPEHIKQYMRAYVTKNRERHNATTAEWGRNNRDKRNELQRRRRAAYVGGLTDAEWQAIKRAFGFKCLRCKQSESLLLVLEPDHVIAVARGGVNAAENIQPLCRNCNAWKGAKTIDYRDGIRRCDEPLGSMRGSAGLHTEAGRSA